jgi:hypothetical protein
MVEDGLGASHGKGKPDLRVLPRAHERLASGSLPSPAAPKLKTPKSVDPPKPTNKVSFEEFRARLYDLMTRAQTLHSQAQQTAWGVQVQALLNDALPFHVYTQNFELAMIGAHRKGLGEAYAVLVALLEDADRGFLRDHNGRAYRG